jgi:2-polyprenyl-6-methoxyphenol hydroxylase-like FAD-dependent oxidoreductase
MSRTPVLIVGAGPTGLVLALWLTRLGVPVRIIDKTPSPGMTSRALAVQARTLEFYGQLGIAEAVIRGGVKVEHVNFWVRGTRVAQAPVGELGRGLSPYSFVLVFPQDAHERLLVERLGELGVRVERQTELLRFEQDGGGVRATLRRPDGSEEVCEASYLAGCDGASSTVRHGLQIGFPGGTYSGLFYVADTQAAGPAVDGQLHVDLEDADFVLLFPLIGQGHVRLVGTLHDVADHEHEALTFDDVKSKAIDHLRLSVKDVNWFSTYRVHHRVANRLREGRVFLLGDAAHIHSPVGGQGMNTGIGDAVNLAWKLAAVLKQQCDAKLLDTYEPERIAFARRLVRTTDRAFTIVTAQGAGARLVRTRLAPAIVSTMLRVARTRRFMFKTVSQITISYHDSPLSQGRAGSVRGGDRLPWVKLASGSDNFAPLASLNWQVHVYGDVRAGVTEVCAQLGLPLHTFEWEERMRKVGLVEGGLFLIRPDGYVALADVHSDPARLRQYSGLGHE